MSLKKPSDFFEKNIEEHNIDLLSDTTSDNTLREELGKVESLSEQITQLQQEISKKVVQTDLEKLVLSQINSMQENFEYLQKDFKTSNKKDIGEFKEKVSELTNIVENILEVEFPKYKKQITKNQFSIGEKFNTLQEVVKDNIVDIKEELNTKLESVAEALDENLEYFNQQLQETSSEVKKTSDTYNKLSKIVESRVSKENEKLEEYSETIKSLYESFVDIQNSLQKETASQVQVIDEKFETISSEIKTHINLVDDKIKSVINSLDEEVSDIRKEVSSEISNVKSDVVINEHHLKKIESYVEENVKEFPNKLADIQKSIDDINKNISSEISSVRADTITNEQHLKKVETYIQENYKQIVDLREEVFEEIEKLPIGNVQENIERLERKIDFIKETYSRIEPEVIVKEVIKEGLLNIPPDEKTSDPLSPLDKNFVTLDQLQEHYRLFINRIQQQLSTLGGGGETLLRYLDDVVGVATNSSAYDGKYLQWNSTTNTAEFTTVTGAGVQVNSDWNATTGISSILNKPSIVNQIVAGTGITISPASGVGIVTITATGGTGAATTGYYGSFYDTTTQYATGVGVTTKIYLNTTAAANGFSIQNGSRIVAENAGVYNTQFSFQLDKAAGSSAHIWIWLSKNGIDLPETNSVVAIQGTNAEVVPAWNFIVDMIAGDYIEYKWITEDVNVGITSGAVPTIGSPPISVNIPDIPSAIVTIQQIAGVVAGVGSTTQTLNQTLGYGNTSSIGMSVGVVTATYFVGDGSLLSNIQYATSAGIATYATTSGIATYATSSGIATYATSSGIATYATTAGISTNVIGGIASVTQLNVSGISTFAGISTFQSTLFSNQLSVSGVSTFKGNTYLADNASLYLGDGNDLRIFHNGSNSFISEVGTGDLFIDAGNTYYRANSHRFLNGASTETLAIFTANGSVELYYDSSKKFETSGVGATVTGTLNTTQLNVSGVATITGNLNAPGNYYVKLARTADQTVLNATDTLLGLSVISDPNSWYSGITTRTTPTVAGTYHVDGMVNWQAGSITNNQTNIQLRKNGSTFAISLVGIHTFSYTQNVCGIVTMNGTTDYIDFTVYTGNPTSQDVRGTADGSWSKMEIFKIN